VELLDVGINFVAVRMGVAHENIGFFSFISRKRPGKKIRALLARHDRFNGDSTSG
jgi:hypothetical protein